MSIHELNIVYRGSVIFNRPLIYLKSYQIQETSINKVEVFDIM